MSTSFLGRCAPRPARSAGSMARARSRAPRARGRSRSSRAQAMSRSVSLNSSSTEAAAALRARRGSAGAKDETARATAPTQNPPCAGGPRSQVGHSDPERDPEDQLECAARTLRVAARKTDDRSKRCEQGRAVRKGQARELPRDGCGDCRLENQPHLGPKPCEPAVELERDFPAQASHHPAHCGSVAACEAPGGGRPRARRAGTRSLPGRRASPRHG